MPSRPRIDWDAAFAFYAALGPPRRFAQVAHKFGVSDTAVRKRAAAERWEERVRALDREAAQRAEKRVVSTRSEAIEETIRVVRAMRIRYAQQLRDGERVRGVDLAAMLRIEALLAGEATERIDVIELKEMIGRVLELALEYVPAAMHDAFLADFGERFAFSEPGTNGDGEVTA